MLGFEFLEVLHILLVFGRLLVLSKIVIVLFLGTLGLALIRLFFSLGQTLPILPNKLGNFRKGQVLTLEVFPHF